MIQLRPVHERKPEIVPTVRDSIEPIKTLLSNVFQQLKLHNKPFQVFSAATEDKMKECGLNWRILMNRWCMVDSIEKKNSSQSC